ncbi:TadE/TadG family type IV pilus assembly protein [Oceaniovalibus guishaninsula]|nr:pilus assembly protein [Oceaniovalibus guishaninsula]
MTGFLRDESGTLSLEAVIVFPLLIWATLGMYVFFDAFRSSSDSERAAYAISDMLSREKSYVTPEYLTALHNVQKVLSNARFDTRIRTSVIGWNKAAADYQLRWSKTSGSLGALQQSDLQAATLRARLPLIADGDQMILLETFTDYSPPVNFGLDPMTLENFVVVRPRQTARLCWNSQNDGTSATETC